jgi:LmbE family N-acetylglucosaminyl deacetylase
VFLTSGELGLKQLPREEAWRVRESEAERAGDVMQVSDLDFLRFPDWYLEKCVEGAAAALAPIVARESPELLYLPHEHETHPDHRATLSIVRAALSTAATASPTLLTYEVWTPLADHYHVEDITPVMSTKLAAIRCHASQTVQLPYARAIRGLNLYRGATAGGCLYAEVFQTAAVV